MKLSEIKDKIPEKVFDILKQDITELRPAQVKAVNRGLLDGKNMLVCTPTASGKTLIAELAGMKKILEENAKVIYIVPLKALASEKYKDFKKKYGSFARVALSIGDLDSADPYLADYDLIIASNEKMDSLIRHHCPWLSAVGCVVVDEVHLLNDPGRGPTLEILLTMLRKILSNVQILALSATIGNPKELANWLDAELIIDSWRPVKLHKGVYLKGKVEFE